jgi:hypothetical protein
MSKDVAEVSVQSSCSVLVGASARPKVTVVTDSDCSVFVAIIDSCN